MIEAAKNGLRVDLTKVPPSPNLVKSLDKPVTPTTDFVVVQPEDCTPNTSNREEIFASLEKSLKHQYEVRTAAPAECINLTQSTNTWQFAAALYCYFFYP